MIFIVTNYDFDNNFDFDTTVISRGDKTIRELGYYVKMQSEEYNSVDCDLVMYVDDLEDYSELIQYKKLITPGVSVALYNAFDNLFQGSFVTTVSDFFILTGYDRLQKLMCSKSNTSMTYEMEKDFFQKEMLSKETIVYTLTNGRILYV